MLPQGILGLVVSSNVESAVLPIASNGIALHKLIILLALSLSVKLEVSHFPHILACRNLTDFRVQIVVG